MILDNDLEVFRTVNIGCFVHCSALESPNWVQKPANAGEAAQIDAAIARDDKTTLVTHNEKIDLLMIRSKHRQELFT